MTFLFFYRVELTFAGEGVKIWWTKGKERVSGWCGGRGGVSIPPIPPVGKNLYTTSVYITYIMCQSGHLTFVRFEHFVCHRYVWYIFSLACSGS